PAARGERFLAVAGPFMSVLEIAKTLKAELGPEGRRVPVRELPDWLVRLGAIADPAVRQITPELGRRKNATSQKARELLGWSPRGNAEALVSTARSLLELELLKA